MIKNWFERGHIAWEKAKLRSAFRLFLAGSKRGDTSCQQNLGYFYDEGIGVAKNLTKAIYWYAKACEDGHSAAAAYNLGLIYLAADDTPQAKKFFGMAISFGDPDPLLELAKLEEINGNRLRAKMMLKRLLAQGGTVTPIIRARAKRRLKKLASPKEVSRSRA